MKITSITIRDDLDYAEFFVSEREDEFGHLGATWTCYSSLGIYGHHWSSMGCPFAEFICYVDEWYLLRKIAKPGDKLAAAFVRKLWPKFVEEFNRLDAIGEATCVEHFKQEVPSAQS